MRLFAYFPAAALLALAGCACVAPEPAITVSVINSLSFDNALTGKRDGLRSAWPMDTLARTTEHFPLAQVKQCGASSAVCNWGVLNARRTFGSVKKVEGGVALELDLLVDVDRSQLVNRMDQNASMTIPADVGALKASRSVKRKLVLEYGTIHKIPLDFGISFELCALRLDAARQPMDKCELAYF